MRAGCAQGGWAPCACALRMLCARLSEQVVRTRLLGLAHKCDANPCAPAVAQLFCDDQDSTFAAAQAAQPLCAIYFVDFVPLNALCIYIYICVYRERELFEEP